MVSRSAKRGISGDWDQKGMGPVLPLLPTQAREACWGPDPEPQSPEALSSLADPGG